MMAAGLTGAGPQVLQQPGQEVAVRITRGQVDPDVAVSLPDAGSDLQELEAQGVDQGFGQLRALWVVAQQLKQAVRGGSSEAAGTAAR